MKKADGYDADEEPLLQQAEGQPRDSASTSSVSITINDDEAERDDSAAKVPWRRRRNHMHKRVSNQRCICMVLLFTVLIFAIVGLPLLYKAVIPWLIRNRINAAPLVQIRSIDIAHLFANESIGARMDATLPVQGINAKFAPSEFTASLTTQD